jgi:L-arabinose isomerase
MIIDESKYYGEERARRIKEHGEKRIENLKKTETKPETVTVAVVVSLATKTQE